jgi:2-iminobutanoate/2-iminopropanoate deaminase
MRKVIATSEAPTAVGPYSQAIAVGGTLYCAGQIPLDPQTGELVAGGVAEQTTRVLENVGGVLRANGMTYQHVVKATVFMTNLAHFGEMNAVYERFFAAPYPARSTIQVAGLPRGAQVEIEVIAVADASA